MQCSFVTNTIIMVSPLVLSDIDECAERMDGCGQICTDTDGSYTCSCNSGYELASNNHQCEGIRLS